MSLSRVAPFTLRRNTLPFLVPIVWNNDDDPCLRAHAPHRPRRVRRLPSTTIDTVITTNAITTIAAENVLPARVAHGHVNATETNASAICTFSRDGSVSFPSSAVLIRGWRRRPPRLPLTPDQKRRSLRSRATRTAAQATRSSYESRFDGPGVRLACIRRRVTNATPTSDAVARRPTTTATVSAPFDEPFGAVTSSGRFVAAR